jgi:F1F0 ATPase subunit 2
MELHIDITVLEAILFIFVGGLIGGFHFLGLWWTINRIEEVKNVWGWILGSMAIRTVVSVSVVLLATGGNGIKIILCMGGFLIMRQILSRRFSPAYPG